MHPPSTNPRHRVRDAGSALARVAAAALLLFTPGLSAQPVRLTSLVGNETEAAWSPDGRRIAFQHEADGDRDILVLDVETGATHAVVTGDGQACYPCWTADSHELIYSFGRLTTTAVAAVTQGSEEGFNLYRIPIAGGAPVQITAGRCRDYTPALAPGGRELWFTSTRGFTKNSAALWRLSMNGAGDAVPERVFGEDAANVGAVQPDLSPDGRLVVFGHYQGIRRNWQLCLLDAVDSSRQTPLTPDSIAAYGPRWSPRGDLIACTGFRPGDPGWGIWLVDPLTGRAVRLETGSGNSRSPAWAPDGTALVFENNRKGNYDLYRIAVGTVHFPVPEDSLPPPSAPVLSFDFTGRTGNTIGDSTGTGNAGTVAGDVPEEAGLARFGAGHIRVPKPKGCDFGGGPFHVTTRIRVDRHTDTLRLVVVCDYPEHRLGWQIFLNDRNQLYFNSRNPAGSFIGVKTGTAFPVGREVTVTGLRDGRGNLELYLDGHLVARAGGATMVYGPPNQIRIGCQITGVTPTPLSFACRGRGSPGSHQRGHRGHTYAIEFCLSGPGFTGVTPEPWGQVCYCGIRIDVKRGENSGRIESGEP